MIADTPIFLMATAGMRFLSQPQQTALLRETCSYLRQNTGFALPDCASNVQVISGETEGLFGWLAANYLLGGFDHPEDHNHGQNHHTYGFLDMGGASAQIAFAPNTTEAAEHADELKLVRLRTMDGNPSEHRVFTATWLGFGVNKARESYVNALMRSHQDLLLSGADIPDPCMPKGLRATVEGHIIEEDDGSDKRAVIPGGTTTAAEDLPVLVGTGDFPSCLLGTKPLLAEDTSCGGGSQPCLIHGPVPSIDYSVNHFVGVSEYYHSTHGFFGEKDGDIAYDFSTYQKKVLDFCSQDWSAISDDIADRGSEKKETRSKKNKNKNKNKNKDKNKDKNNNQKDADRALQDAQQACFKASWVISVLHEGIGIPRVGLEKVPGLNVSHETLEEAKSGGYVVPFRPVDKIDSVEVSWTLGRMLLYASGQIPPHGMRVGDGNGKGVAVGFGSNVKDGSIPADFTYAGSSWEPLKSGAGDGDDWSDAADDVLDKARKKSAVPSVLLFLLLLLLFGFFLRKKERRLRFFNKFGSLLRRSRRSGSPRKSAGRFGVIGGGSSSSGSGGSLVGRAKRLLFRGHAAHDYERVLEEGQLDQFELGDVDSPLDDNDFTSDSSDGSLGSGASGASSSSAALRLLAGSSSSLTAAARASGLATPTLNVDKFEDLRPAGIGSASGLVARTESRDRLGLGLGAPSLQMLNAGRRSRATSPTRLKSPMLGVLPDD